MFLTESVHENKLEEDSVLFKIAFENLCNAYDTFCGKYLAGEISKIRFSSDYADEVIGWVDAFPEYYKENSAFQNTVKVYKKLKVTK